MTQLIHIDSVNGVDVVDSRLIAEDLEIQHKNLLATINKYKPEIEADFGILAFETAVLHSDKILHYWLNEEQANYVMSLSRNTSKVRSCKRKLVKSFSHAKKIINHQAENIRQLQLELDLVKAKQKLLDTRNTIVTTCPEIVQQKILGYEVVKEVVEKEVVVDKRTGDRFDGVGIGYLTKKYGFKNNNQTWAYLETIGLGKNSVHWKGELSAVYHKKLDRQMLDYIDEVFYDGERQINLGE